MLIGRTRTGKSTIEQLLADPMAVPDTLTLKSGTRDPKFESICIPESQVVFDIIDTPGLFERVNETIDIRDNETIMETIKMCANREISQLHVICFCVSINYGINQEDILSIQLLIDFFGQEISSNACLIVTRCESKNEDQLARLRDELLNDYHFRTFVPFFKLGIFFSGSLDRDDYDQANERLYYQYARICNYRTELIELFKSEIKPFPITEMLMSKIRSVP